MPMNRLLSYYFLVVLVLAACIGISPGQGKNSQMALRELLRQFSKKTGTRLIYNDALVEGKMADAALAEIGNDSSIAAILEQNGVRWKKLPNGPMILYSQQERNITGMIIDKEQNAGVPYANIRLKGTHAGTTSDENGFFHIMVQPVHLCTLLVAHIGYQSYEMPLLLSSKQEKVLVPLQQRQLPVPGMTITANSEPDGIFSRDGNYVLSPAKIAAIPGESPKDILQAVQSLPGMTSFDTGLSVHGNWPGQNRILFNGIPILAPYHLFGFISAVDPQTIDEVTVYRGRGPFELGDFSGGIILLKSLTHHPKRPQMTVGINSLYSHAMCKIPVAKTSALLLSFRDSHLQKNLPLYRQIFRYQTGYDLSVPVEQYGRTTQPHSIMMDGSMVLKWNATKKHAFEGSVLWHQNRYWQADISGEPLTDDYQGENNSVWTGLTWGFKYRQIWNAKWLSTLTVYQAGNRSDFADYATAYRMTFIDRNVKWDHTYQYSERQTFLLGLGFAQKNLSKQYAWWQEPYVIYPPERGRQWYLSAQHQLQVASHFHIESGLHATQYVFKTEEPVLLMKPPYQKTCYEPSLRLIYKINESWSTDLDLYQSYQFAYSIDYPPSQREVRFEYRVGKALPDWQLAEKLHQPVRTRHAQVSAYFSNNVFDCSVAAYAQHTLNYDMGTMVGLQNLDISSPYQVVNSHQSSMGVDCFLEKRSETVTGWLSYTLGRVREHGNLLPNENYAELGSTSISSLFTEDHASPLDIRHAVNLGLQASIKNWNLSAVWKYHSGQPYNKPVGFFQLKDLENNIGYYFDFYGINRFRLPHYQAINISLTKSYFSASRNRSLELGITVTNLLGHKNVLYRTYHLEKNSQDQPFIRTSEVLTPRFQPNLFLALTL